MELRKYRSMFDFWADLPAGTRIHPADVDILERTPHSFDLRCLPAPWTGRLRTAKLVLLLLSPGLDVDYDIEHGQRADAIEWYKRQLSGFEPLPTLTEHATHHVWWTRKIRQFGLDAQQARGNVAVLDMTPYHSVKFEDWHLLSALPSARRCLDWAQNVLFPDAIAGKRVVVCLRSAKHWGLSEGRAYGRGLFAPACTRGGFMFHGEQRERLISQVQALFYQDNRLDGVGRRYRHSTTE